MDDAPVPELINEVVSEEMPEMELYMESGMVDPMPISAEIDPGAVGLFAAMGLGMFIVWAAMIILIIASLWKIFSKANRPGWAAIVPIYNAYILFKIAGKPGWWLLLLFIPLVNFIIIIIVWIEIAKAFGKGTGYALGLIFLGIIFAPMLAFGDAQYTEPVGEGSDDTQQPPQQPNQRMDADPISTPDMD